jgi:type I restriction enzyme S subunit
MAGDWEETLLAEVIDIKHGYAFSGQNIRDEPMGDILLTPGNFAVGGGFKGDKFKYFEGEVPQDYVLNEGDLVVTMTDLSKQADTLGFPALVPKPRGQRFLHNQRLGKVLIKPGASLDKRFLFYLLRSSDYRHEVLAGATGTTVKHTSPGRILAHRAIIPPLAEQKAIAAVLGVLDEKIELNRRINATLEAMARALFQSWFVDFDPVRAKLDGRQPSGLDSAKADLFPDHFDHGAEGVVPKGWARKCWGDIATLEYGRSLRDYRAGGGKYRVFGTNGPIGFHDEALCSSAGIVIGRKGAYRGVHYSPDPFYVIDTAFYLKPKFPLDLNWAYYELIRLDINGMDSGSAIPSTSRDDFYSIPVILPPPPIQAEFGKILSAWSGTRYANDHQSRTLAALRDALLPKLLSGEILLKEIA